MLENTRYFVKVVQLGSFTKAAQVLGLPKSTVSRAVQSLENESGTKLLLRTTRSVSLTSAGRAFFDACVAPLLTLEDAQKSLKGQDSIISGRVKITAPEDLGAFVVSPTIAMLSRLHPKLSFEVHYTNEMVDLVRDGYDFAVRVGKLHSSSFKVRKAGVIQLVLVANENYLKTAPRIEHPNQLIQQSCITLNIPTVIPKWTIARGAEKSMDASITPRFVCNQMTAIVKIALESGGIGFVPKYLVDDHIQSGRLVRVLPEWSQNQFQVSVVIPSASASSARIKICTDAIVSGLSKALT
ncbi:MAG: LysR family transcriptional regulator [Proteobacteria bacterium]|nr:LysR family transcriptional regulator [Pseudomonadota bacterium]